MFKIIKKIIKKRKSQKRERDARAYFLARSLHYEGLRIQRYIDAGYNDYDAILKANGDI